MKSILSVLNGKNLSDKKSRQPIWLMRQAGRYLPEYKATRAKAGSFMGLALNPELAAEVTLQPVRRFDMDAAILFSDILIVPYGLGQQLDFVEGEGPKLEPITNKLPAFNEANFFARTQNVFSTVRLCVGQLNEHTAMIGFAGSPFTVACYLFGGTSKDGFKTSLERAAQDPAFFTQTLNVLADATVFYLSQQIIAGAEVVQLFDSWSGLAPAEKFAEWIIHPTQRIVAGVKKLHPHTPIIGFPRGSGERTKNYAAAVNVDAISIDENTQISWAEKNIRQPLQGNLAPGVMAGDQKTMLAAAQTVMQQMTRPYIFNLGHGLTPDVPPDNVAALVKFVHGNN